MAAKSDKCEYRIFFPLPAEGGGDEQLFEADDAARPFSLFDAEHFHLFQPTHSTPVAPSAKQVEQRDDIYLLVHDMTVSERKATHNRRRRGKKDSRVLVCVCAYRAILLRRAGLIRITV